MNNVNSVETLRWADQERKVVAVGQTGVRSRELVRVRAPYPATWRIICAGTCDAAGNFPLPLRLVINIGIGSFTTQAFFDVAFNAIFNFEIPAQDIQVFYQVNDAVVAADTFVFGAGIAQNTPSEGMRVVPVKV